MSATPPHGMEDDNSDRLSTLPAANPTSEWSSTETSETHDDRELRVREEDTNGGVDEEDTSGEEESAAFAAKIEGASIEELRDMVRKQDTDLRLAAEIGMGLLEQNEGYQADVARLERELEALRQQLAGTKTAAATQERTISELKQQVATATAAASRGEGIPPRPPHHSNIARALNPSSLSSSSPSSSSHAATTELLSPTDGSSLPHYHSALPAPAVPSLPTSKTLVDIYHKVSHRLQPPSSTSTSLTPTGLQGELVSPGSTSIDAASDVDVTIPLSPSSAYLLVVLNQVEALNTRTSQPKLPISVSFSSSSSSSALSVASAQPSHSAASSSSSSASSSSANLVPYQGVCKECHNPLLSPSPRSLPPTPHTSSSSSSSSSFSSSEDSEADNDFFDLYKAYVEALSAISILLQDKANLSSSASSPSIPPSSAAAASSSAVEIRVSAAGNGAQGLQSAPAPTPSLPLADSLALSVAAASVRRSSLADLGLNNADRSPEEQLQSLDRAYMALLQQMRALQLELDASSAAKTEADRALEVALAQVAEAEARAFACEQDAKAAREERIAAADEKGEEATARRAAEHLVDVLTLQRMEAQNTVKAQEAELTVLRKDLAAEKEKARGALAKVTILEQELDTQASSQQTWLQRVQALETKCAKLMMEAEVSEGEHRDLGKRLIDSAATLARARAEVSRLTAAGLKAADLEASVVRAENDLLEARDAAHTELRRRLAAEADLAEVRRQLHAERTMRAALEAHEEVLQVVAGEIGMGTSVEMSAVAGAITGTATTGAGEATEEDDGLAEMPPSSFNVSARSSPRADASANASSADAAASSASGDHGSVPSLLHCNPPTRLSIGLTNSPRAMTPAAVAGGGGGGGGGGSGPASSRPATPLSSSSSLSTPVVGKGKFKPIVVAHMRTLSKSAFSAIVTTAQAHAQAQLQQQQGAMPPGTPTAALLAHSHHSPMPSPTPSRSHPFFGFDGNQQGSRPSTPRFSSALASTLASSSSSSSSYSSSSSSSSLSEQSPHPKQLHASPPALLPISPSCRAPTAARSIPPLGTPRASGQAAGLISPANGLTNNSVGASFASSSPSASLSLSFHPASVLASPASAKQQQQQQAPPSSTRSMRGSRRASLPGEGESLLTQLAEAVANMSATTNSNSSSSSNGGGGGATPTGSSSGSGNGSAGYNTHVDACTHCGHVPPRPPHSSTTTTSTVAVADNECAANNSLSTPSSSDLFLSGLPDSNVLMGWFEAAKNRQLPESGFVSFLEDKIFTTAC